MLGCRCFSDISLVASDVLRQKESLASQRVTRRELASRLEVLVEQRWNVEGQHAACVGDVPDVDIDDHAVILAYTCICVSTLLVVPPTEATDAHAIVVVETTWLLRNLRRDLCETSTPCISDGSFSPVSSPFGFWLAGSLAVQSDCQRSRTEGS